MRSNETSYGLRVACGAGSLALFYAQAAAAMATAHNKAKEVR